MKTALKELLMGGPGHDGYGYNADVYCVECGQAIIRALHAAGKLPPTLEECADTEVCPSPIFFGESPDSPQCCGECGEYMYGKKEPEVDRCENCGMALYVDANGNLQCLRCGEEGGEG